MALDFKLPDIGEGIAEGEIVKWLVKVGDVVKEHQSIVEVMTDKATVEVPAPAAGKITAIKAKEGEIVPVGSVIFVLDTSASAPGALGTSASAPGALGTSASTPGVPGASASAPQAAAPSARAASSTPAPTTSTAGATSVRSGAPASASPAPSASSPARAGAPAAAGSRQPAAEASRPAPAAGSTQSTIEFKLPDIGEGIAEGEIVKWLVKVGDAVKEHQSVVEVMTDKATVEVPAPASGTITAIQAKEGEVVPVGTVIFKLATQVAAGATQPSIAARAPAHAPATAAREPALVGAASSARWDTASGTDAVSTGTRDKVLAVPSARRVAREMGVDLSRVAGSGRNGVVRRADVESFVKQAPPTTAPAREAAPGSAPARAPAAPISIPVGTREKRTPFRGVRRKIAEAMVRSKFTAPHFTVVEEVDVTDLVSLREKAKALGAESGIKVTFMPFIMKATALALAKYPMLNGHLDEAAQELVHYEYVNLGIAMDTEQGLIVPVVKEVQGKGILQLAVELHELAERTRAGKVKPDDLKGSTFSITNAGNIGGTLATPIINFPDIAILGVHRLMKKPGVVETPSGDKIEVRQYMNFSVSVDHRLADGADGARFLVYVKKLLESPGLLAL